MPAESQSIGQVRGLVIACGEGVPVGHLEEALVLVLKPHPVNQHSGVIAEMEFSGGPHAAQYSLSLHLLSLNITDR
jgi:hypothetical protein